MSDYLGPAAAACLPDNAADYDASLAERHHSVVHLPTPRLLTYNIRTFSGLPTDLKVLARQNRVFSNIHAVIPSADIVLLQETKSPPDAVYDSFRAEWYVFRNYCTRQTVDGVHYLQKAGTATLVRKKFCHNFDLRHEILVPGYLQRVLFTPLGRIDKSRPFFDVSFSVDNVYMPSSCDRDKVRLLRTFGSSGSGCDYSFAGGDWNVVDSSADTATGHPSSAKLLAAVAKAMGKRGLEEVWHPAMTKISNHTPPQVSRLDKWYISHTKGEREVMKPLIRLPTHPYEPGVDRKAPSDHFPLSLSFHPTASSRGRSSIPAWLAKKPEFAAEVARRWKASPAESKPCDELRTFNNILLESSSFLLSNRRHSTESRADATKLACAVFTGITKGKITLAQAVERCALNTLLGPMVDGCSTLEEVADKLQYFLWSGDDNPPSPYQARRSAFSEKVSSHQPESVRTGPDYNKRVKSALGPGAQKLSFLKTEDDCITADPEEMAELLCKAWEPIWGVKRSSPDAIKAFLRSYKKRVRSPISQIELTDVINELLVQRSTCPGPNGIPFACYSALCDLAAPIFHRVILHLASGGAPKADFNECTLFFIPKDGTGDPLANRPIAASNTDNRLISNIIRRKLETAILPILSASQIGFVKGRMIDENVCFFNEAFYKALYTRFSSHHPAPDLRYRVSGKWVRQSPTPDDGTGHDYTITFFDFKKAYDSVSRAFTLALLEHIGVPAFYTNLISALFHDVTAIPAIFSSGAFHISMKDGLKQGCPLAPLLFILVIDPLLTLLDGLPDVDPRCFADDTAVGARRVESLTPVFFMFDRWSAVSGCQVNFKKTKLLTTATDPPPTSSFVPAHWNRVTYADSYVYLGVLMGRGVDVTMVYQAAMDKLEARIRSNSCLRPYLNLAAKVRFANTYLIPILSYLNRFFLMSEVTTRRLAKLLRGWLLKCKSTNLHRLAAPTHLVGLSNPMRDPAWVNMAALLKGRASIANPAIRGTYSMLIADHVEHAAVSFEAITGSAFESYADQASLFEALRHSDCKKLHTLAKTMRARFARQGREEDPLQITGVIARNCLALPTSLRSELRNHTFNIVHQRLFTNHRARRYGTARGCSFCGGPVEDLQHLLVDCVVARWTIDAMRAEAKVNLREAAGLLAEATVRHHRLEVPIDSADHFRALLCFSLAIWKTRRFFTSRSGPKPSKRAGAARARVWSALSRLDSRRCAT